MTRRRLDAELVRRGLARSRDHAAELVGAGLVRVAGQAAAKAATQVEAGAPIVIDTDAAGPTYVSRGGHKLAGALASFTPRGLAIRGRRCLDAGASTGGFTQVLLQAGAAQVVAVDVGYGQLAWLLRQDPRVAVHDRTHVRDLRAAAIGGPVDCVVAVLSFISLTGVLPALVSVTLTDADLVLLVKPQFEVGRGRLGPGGVVRDPVLRAAAVRTVAASAWDLGVGVRGVVASPLPGPAGNVEYFLWLVRGAGQLADAALAAAVAEGPQ